MLSKKQSTESYTVNTFINKNELLLEHLLTVFWESGVVPSGLLYFLLS